MDNTPSFDVTIRNTRPEDFESIIALGRKIYPEDEPWEEAQLASHLKVFPEGQFVAVTPKGDIVGMAASLVVYWDDYDHIDDWMEFTDQGFFTNHDPESGRTLYGAEVMVDPDCQGLGVGSALYAVRRRLVKSLRLKRIRAGARLQGYGAYAAEMDAITYVRKVIRGEIGDPTLSFQLNQGFDVLAVIRRYLADDPQSLGWAALIEWLNPEVATDEDWARRDPRFRRPTD